MKLLIEVGAHDGHDSLKYFNNGYKVISFEPQNNLYNNLYEKTKHLENYTLIKKAVCLTDGVTNFNICKAGGASSILDFRDDSELIREWNENRTDIHFSGETYEVETIRLDTFIEENQLQNEIIDFLHIDAQGVDLECLMSLGKYIKNVKEGVLETVMDEKKTIYKNQNQNIFKNVSSFLHASNFSIINVQNNDNTNCEYNVYFKNNEM